MTLTSRGKKWEILNSFWILFTFVLGMLNWLAFFYIGFTVKKKLWIAWGVFYLLLTIIFMSKLGGLSEQIYSNLIMLSWVAGIIHSFLVRKEYLIRLDIIKRSDTKVLNNLKRKIEKEYELLEEEHNGAEAIKQDSDDSQLEWNHDDVSMTTDSKREVEEMNLSTVSIDGKEETSFMQSDTNIIHKTTDFRTIEFKKTNMQIKNAYTAGFISGAFTLLVIFLSLVGIDIFGTISLIGLLDVALLIGLSYGVYQKNNACAILLFSYSLFSKIVMIVTAPNIVYAVSMTPLSLVFLYFYFQGMRGTSKYHLLVRTAEKEEIKG